jgi:hypothetical protein
LGIGVAVGMAVAVSVGAGVSVGSDVAVETGTAVGVVAETELDPQADMISDKIIINTDHNIIFFISKILYDL